MKIVLSPQQYNLYAYDWRDLITDNLLQVSPVFRGDKVVLQVSYPNEEINNLRKQQSTITSLSLLIPNSNDLIKRSKLELEQVINDDGVITLKELFNVK